MKKRTSINLVNSAGAGTSKYKSKIKKRVKRKQTFAKTRKTARSTK